MARRTIEVFERCEGSVVVPSGSCAHMLRHGYLELFRDEPLWLPRAERLAGRTYELSEFLVEQVGVQGFSVRYPHKLAYHPSCHLLRGLGVVEPPLQLLRSLEALSSRPCSCCARWRAVKLFPLRRNVAGLAEFFPWIMGRYPLRCCTGRSRPS